MNTFDDPTVDHSQTSNKSSTDLENKLAQLRWNLFDKALTRDFTYRQYITTARRMRGKKYSLLLAKQYFDNDESSSSDGNYNVVGVVEMGMCPPLPASKSPSDVLQSTQNLVLGADASFSLANEGPQPTIGLLCVKSTHQTTGIGGSLLQKCQYIAKEIWKHPNIYVDVEPNNKNALKFFEKSGYEYVMEDGGDERMMRNTSVFRRRVREVRSHFLLRKRLEFEVDDIVD